MDVSQMNEWADDLAAMSTQELCDEIEDIGALSSTILEGRLKNNRWNGFGTSLCIRGMIATQEAMNRWVGPGWPVLHAHFVQAQYLMSALGERAEKPESAGEGKPRMNTTHALSSRHPACCKGCGGRGGFTNLAEKGQQWWVCGKCLLPTEQWFRAQGDGVLNKFTGGPLDGMVYTSSSMLNDPALCSLILGYRFTPEIVKSENTGAIARVWLHGPGQPGSVSLAINTESHSPRKGNKMSVQETPESTETPAEAVAPVEPVKTDDLLATRQRLGLSRTPVSEAAGVSVAQLARIEKGGNRTTAAEAQQVRDALAKLEAEAPAPAAAAAEVASNPT